MSPTQKMSCKQRQDTMVGGSEIYLEEEILSIEDVTYGNDDNLETERKNGNNDNKQPNTARRVKQAKNNEIAENSQVYYGGNGSQENNLT